MKTAQFHIKLTVFCLAVLAAGGNPAQIFAAEMLSSYVEIHELSSTEEVKEQREEILVKSTVKKRTSRFPSNNPTAYADFSKQLDAADSLIKRASQGTLPTTETDHRYMLLMKLSYFGFFQSHLI